MTELEMLNRVREAIACLDEAANYISIESGVARKLHSRIQDAGDALVEVREELQVRIEVQERLKRSLER
jgi:hypothetical protein